MQRHPRRIRDLPARHRHRTGRLAAGLASVVLLVACSDPGRSFGTRSCPGGDTPAAAVCGFYQAYLTLHPSGLPDRAAQDRLAPYLSPQLLQLLDDARTYQQEFAQQHPGEKPPFADGCLFASLFEGPEGFELRGTEALPDGSVQVHVRFRYTDDAEWEDVVIVTRDQSRWAIDDVLLSGAGPFNPGGRLTERLAFRG